MVRNARLLLPLGLALVLGTAVASTASADTFTLSAPIVLDGSETGNPGVLGTINPVGDYSGTTTSLNGTPFAGNDVFVIDITLDLGTAPHTVTRVAFSVAPNLFNILDAGYFDSPGDDPDSIDPGSIGLLAATFHYNVDNLVAGETTTRLFAVYGPEGTLASNDTATINLLSGTSFMVQGTIVPEPGTLGLMALGLAAIASLTRGRAR